MATTAGVKRSYHQVIGNGSPGAQVKVEPRKPTPSDSSPSGEVSDHPVVTGTGSSIAIGSSAISTLPPRSTYDNDASIVLLGIRGVGTSTLGVLAASAYQRKLVEVERPSSLYRKQYGTVEYCKRHLATLVKTLDSYSKNCVIVCSVADLDDDCAKALRKYAETHPVLHIIRDAKGTSSYLGCSEASAKQLLQTSSSMLLYCSNFEFFNVSEGAFGASRSTDQYGHAIDRADRDAHSTTFLTLKRAERDFLKTLKNIIGDRDRGPSHHSAYALSLIAVELRQWTFAVVLRAQEVIDDALDFDDMQIGADALELIISPSTLEEDPNLAAKAFAKLRRTTILPVILTIDDVEEAQARDIDLMAKYVEKCLRLAPEFVSVPLSLRDDQLRRIARSRASAKLIGSFEVSRRPCAGWTDRQWKSAWERCHRLDIDVVRFSMPAESQSDNLELQLFRRDMRRISARPRLIGFNTGRAGRTASCFNDVMTPVRPEALRNSQSPAKLPLISAKESEEGLFATFVLEPMHFTIYGGDVSWSLSPAMHNAAYKTSGMPHRYETCSCNTLDEFRRNARDVEFGGAAITQPFKTEVLKYVDALSPHAEVIQAVNTIIPLRQLGDDGSIPDQLGILSQRNKQGPVKALYGDNTDWIGIRACIRRGLSPANTVRNYSTGVVCGAGGMARSAVYAMISLGVRNIFVCNRTVEKANDLAYHYNSLIAAKAIKELNEGRGERTVVRVIESFADDWPAGFRPPTMVVCSIPVISQADGPSTNFTIPPAWIKSQTGGVVVEIAYRPMITPVVRQMRAEAYRGWILMDGFDMLPEQAFAQFEIFTGRRAPRKLMRDVVLKHFYQSEDKESD